VSDIISVGDAIKFFISAKTGLNLKSVLQGIIDSHAEAEKVQQPIFSTLDNKSLKFQLHALSMFK
jgi:hypothetical protein